MPTNNTGIKNENEFRKYLNQKQIKEINGEFKAMLPYFFTHFDENSCIESWSIFTKKKADISIKIEGEIRSFSIKMGYKNSVHTEWIYTFIDFLRSIGVNQVTITRLKKYHFADGTVDGTGTFRLSAKEYQEKYPEEIKKINEEINKPHIVKEVIKRCVTQGNYARYEIDGLIYGTIDHFIWISKEEIHKLASDEFFLKLETNGVHFGPLFYQTFGRCLNGNDKYEHLRKYMQVKWYNIHEHIEIISSKRNSFI